MTAAARLHVHEKEGALAPDGTHDGHRPRVGLAAGTAVAYVLVSWVTAPVFVADTPDMAVSAVARVFGLNCSYFEPGHFLWRPTGHAMLTLFGTASPGANTDAVLRASQVQFGWMAWLAGLVAMVACAVWLRGRLNTILAACAGTAAILLSKAFLNYTQVGASYVPALAFLMLAVLLLSRRDVRRAEALFAGALLGASVLMWATFALALPAALAAPMLFGPDVRRGISHAGWATLGGSAVAVAATFWVWNAMQFGSFDALVTWAATADHGISTGGLPRAVLGFARSFLETGDYGKLVKRFLIGDAGDPVSIRELVGFPLLGLLVFYAGILAAMLAAYRHERGGRHLVFFALNAIPVAAFAVAWQGGDLERYLPLVPGMALLVATAFDTRATWPKVVIAAWMGVIVVPNALALGAPLVERERNILRDGLRAIESPSRPLVMFSHWQDGRVQLSRNYPPDEDPINVRFYSLLTPGTASVIDWRSRAARRILGAWEDGTDVFISERLLIPTPEPDWAWVEGDDERVSWRDFEEFFGSLTLGGPVGSPGDGFRMLPPTAGNRAILESSVVPEAAASARGCNLPPVITTSAT